MLLLRHPNRWTANCIMAFKWPRRINVTKCYKLPYQMNINKSTLCRKSLTDTNADVRYTDTKIHTLAQAAAAISSWWGELAPSWSTNMANMSIQQNEKIPPRGVRNQESGIGFGSRESGIGIEAGQMEMRTNLDCKVLTQPDESRRNESKLNQWSMKGLSGAKGAARGRRSGCLLAAFNISVVRSLGRPRAKRTEQNQWRAALGKTIGTKSP